jgi:tetratricopeptide (TPR) repeat protein
MDRFTNQGFSEEDLKKCPHFNKKPIMESPFKEKITINSETEYSGRKSAYDDEIERCPFKSKMAEKEVAVPEEDESDDEPQGGCPVMAFKPHKVNPGLFIPEPCYSVPYISPFHSFLSPAFSFGPFQQKTEKTQKWRQMPSFMKNSLFYFGENFDKYRNMEVGYKFFVSDELREKGNMAFVKGKYAEALSQYEKAASILRWLECTPDEFVQKLKDLPKCPQGEADNETENSGSTDIREDKEEAKEPKTPAQIYEDKLSDLMLTSFNDTNIKVCHGPLSKENGDFDIQDNILFGLYSNIAMCYLKMQNIKEARRTLAEMEKVSPKTSILLFRKSQIITCDLSSSLDELLKVQADIEQALELKKTEKIFEHNTNFLKMFNLQNHETIFDDMRSFVGTRIADVKNKLKTNIDKVLDKAKRLERIELDIISRGMTPEEGHERTLFLFQKDQDFEHKLFKQLLKKYKQIVYFFASSEKVEDKEQMQLAIKAMLGVKKLYLDFKLMWNMDMFTYHPIVHRLVEDSNAELKVKLNEDRIRGRVQRIQREMSREMIESELISIQL